jgi:hypothetical protein
LSAPGGFASGRDRFVLEFALVMIDSVAVLVTFFVVSLSAGFDGVNRLFVRGFGFDVGAFLRAQRVNFFGGLGFFGRVVGNFNFIDDVNFLDFFLIVFFVVIFIECRATNDGVGGSVRLNFILLGFDDARCEGGDFVVAERGLGRSFISSVVAIVFQFVSGSAILRSSDRAFVRAV